VKTASYIPHCASLLPKHEVVASKSVLLDDMWEEHLLYFNIKLYCCALTNVLFFFKEESYSSVVQEKVNTMTPQSYNQNVTFILVACISEGCSI